MKVRMIIMGLIAWVNLGALQAMEVQGHRGARGMCSENTLAAFQMGIEAGADVLELDLLLTQDEEVIIHHHYFVNPHLCTHSDGSAIVDSPLICCVSLSQIKEFDCGSKVDPQFPKQLPIPNAKIPTLQELFELIKSSSHPNAKKIRLNLEIKKDTRHPEYTPPASIIAKKVIDKVKQHGFSDRVYYSSFDPEVLGEIRKLDSDALIAYNFNLDILQSLETQFKERGEECIIKIASQLQAKILSPSHTLLTDKNQIEQFHALGFVVIPWSVNDPKRWSELIQMGVDGIITDYPLDLVEFLEKERR